MRTAWRGGRCGVFWALGLSVALVAEAQDQPSRPSLEPLTLHARVREVAPAAKGSGSAPSGATEKILRWGPAQTAIIICDMWNQHWRSEERRVGKECRSRWSP